MRNRVLSCVLLGVLAGAGVSPVLVRAQEPSATLPETSAPSAKNPVASPESQAQPGQIKKEEQEEDNVYRHTKLVQALARMFHLDVETTARLFEWINFAIVALAIVIPIGRFLPKVFRKRSETLRQNLENARKTTADANARLSAVEAQLSRLDEEIGKIRAQVEQESQQDEARIKATIEEERARIVAAAEQEIAVAAAQARRGLRHFAADLAIEQAAQQLTLTPETDRALIQDFVRETANGAAKGGRN
ncbi:ATP synthase F0 subunit B [Acidobacteria bacterium AB60]|nr:ATP synthase F0 subunit B [Acidobacteria bacterium AB60]